MVSTVISYSYGITVVYAVLRLPKRYAAHDWA